jgi:hypothetical protein
VPNAGRPVFEPRIWVSVPLLLGHVAMWAVRQYPAQNPPRLNEVLQQLGARCKSTLRDTAETPHSDEPMMECDRVKLHHFLLFTLPVITRMHEWKAIDMDALIINTCNSIFREDQ